MASTATPAQQKIIDAAMHFVSDFSPNSPTTQFLLIQGSAGSGKTATVKFIVESIQQAMGKKAFDIFIPGFSLDISTKLAVILEQIEGRSFTVTPCTLHAFPGVAIQTDADSILAKLESFQPFPYHYASVTVTPFGGHGEELTIFIVDEIYLCDPLCIELAINRIMSFSKYPNAKQLVLFMGDPRQIMRRLNEGYPPPLAEGEEDESHLEGDPDSHFYPIDALSEIFDSIRDTTDGERVVSRLSCFSLSDNIRQKLDTQYLQFLDFIVKRNHIDFTLLQRLFEKHRGNQIRDVAQFIHQMDTSSFILVGTNRLDINLEASQYFKNQFERHANEHEILPVETGGDTFFLSLLQLYAASKQFDGIVVSSCPLEFRNDPCNKRLHLSQVETIKVRGGTRLRVKDAFFPTPDIISKKTTKTQYFVEVEVVDLHLLSDPSKSHIFIPLLLNTPPPLRHTSFCTPESLQGVTISRETALVLDLKQTQFLPAGTLYMLLSRAPSFDCMYFSHRCVSVLLSAAASSQLLTPQSIFDRHLQGI
jgi:hypothetical protein